VPSPSAGTRSPAASFTVLMPATLSIFDSLQQRSNGRCARVNCDYTVAKYDWRKP
jgi:hypothetical protein